MESNFEEQFDEQEGQPNSVMNDVWRKLKKHKTTIAVYTVSAAISVGVIVTQQQVIKHKDKTISEQNMTISENMDKLQEQQINLEIQQKSIQLQMKEHFGKLDSIENMNENDNNNKDNASNGFWSGFAGTAVALAARTAVGVIFGV